MTSVFLYSFDVKKEKLGLAQAHDLNASYKDLTQVCAVIRRKPLNSAKKILEDAVKEKKAIPYHRFNTGLGHRSNLGGRKGRYPKKECKIVLTLLKNAEANASQKGLDKEKLFVKHAAAYKQNTFRRYKRYWAGGNTLGYGKQSTWSNYETARMELALAQHAVVPPKEKGTEPKKEDEKTKQKPKETIQQEPEKSGKPVEEKISEKKE